MLELTDPDSMQDVRLLEEELALSSDVNGNASFNVHSPRSFASPVIFSDDGSSVFRYSPVYALLSGFNTTLYQSTSTSTPASVLWTEEYANIQRTVLGDILVMRFWAYVTDVLRYFPSADLRERVTVILQKYMASGTKSVSASFNPDQPMTIFLWGTAGTGKSTFVRVLSDALRFIVSRAFEPHKRVEIVRVPFNQTSPAALVSMLLVRGISDWSLERIVEQCVCRAGLALLHLEEQPPAPALQDELFGLTSKMVTTLCNRYPEYRHNVINVLTSNYPPSHGIENKSGTETVLITPPDQPTQATWCARTLEDIIASNVIQLSSSFDQQQGLVESTTDTSASLELANLPAFHTYPSPPPYFQHRTLCSSVVKLDPAVAGTQRFLRFLVAINLQTPPPFTPDLRKLETWKRSVAFSMLSHLHAHGETSLACASRGVTHSASSSLPSSLSTTGSASPQPSSYLLNLALVGSIVSTPHASIPGAVSIVITFTHPPSRDGATDHSLTGDGKCTIPPLYLASQDGFFYFFDPTNNGMNGSMSIESVEKTDLASTNTGKAMSSSNSTSSQRPSFTPTSLLFWASPQALLSRAYRAHRRFRSKGTPGIVPANVTVITSVNTSLPSPRANAALSFTSSLPKCIPVESWGRVRAILDMWISNFLRPAVLVLTGTTSQVEEAAAFVRSVVHTMASPVVPAVLQPSQRFTVKDASVMVNTNLLALDVAGAAEKADKDGYIITDDTVVSPHLAAQCFFPSQHIPLMTSTSAVENSNLAPLPPLLEFYAHATTEAHRRQLFGDPDPATGALLRFIQTVNLDSARFAKRQAAQNGSSLSPSLSLDGDDSTFSSSALNAAGPQAENASVGVVYCRVNSLGQFMLRELLDAGESATHITSVKKDRLLFIVMVERSEQEAHQNAAGDQSDDKNSNIQPQLISRSHGIVSLQ